VRDLPYGQSLKVYREKCRHKKKGVAVPGAEKKRRGGKLGASKSGEGEKKKRRTLRPTLILFRPARLFWRDLKGEGGEGNQARFSLQTRYSITEEGGEDTCRCGRGRKDNEARGNRPMELRELQWAEKGKREGSLASVAG